jgi:hypothetical protein
MLLDRVARLRELAAQAAPLLPAVVQRQQARFLERWAEALAGAQAAGANPNPAWPTGPRNVRWAKRRPLPSASTWPKNFRAWVPTWTRSNAAAGQGRRRTGQAAGAS